MPPINATEEAATRRASRATRRYLFFLRRFVRRSLRWHAVVVATNERYRFSSGLLSRSSWSAWIGSLRWLRRKRHSSLHSRARNANEGRHHVSVQNRPQVGDLNRCDGSTLPSCNCSISHRGCLIVQAMCVATNS